MPILGPSDALSPRQWGARVDYDAWRDLYTPDDGIALHHGGGTDYRAGRTPWSQAEEMKQLRAWEAYHIDARGWRGLAYGWGVGQSGTIYRIRGWASYGAHSGDMDGDGIGNNSEIIPIIWIASGNHHQVSSEAANAIKRLRRFIESQAPKATRLYGHQELGGTVTSCPGPGGMAYVTANRRMENDLVSQLPELRRGDGFTGRESLKPYVQRAQAMLAIDGFIASNTFDSRHRPDGLFGSGTESAVRSFQTARRLSADGVVGESTWKALLRV